MFRLTTGVLRRRAHTTWLTAAVIGLMVTMLPAAAQAAAPSSVATATASTGAGRAPWTTIVRGNVNTCGLRADRSAWCWGNNTAGQVGAGTRATVVEHPRQLPGQWLSIDIGDQASCGVQVDQSGWCWGNQDLGTVGDGTTAHRRSVPTRLPGSWTSITLGASQALTSFTACGVQTDGSGWCWGANRSGQVGNGTRTTVRSPSRLPGEGWSSFSITGDTTCGTRVDGSGWCWGRNNLGLVGDGTTTNRSTPTQLPGLGWSRITVGASLACGVQADHSGWCWGPNAAGEVGDGTTINRSAPSRVAGDWASIEVDRYFTWATCGLRLDGSAWCWGSNAYGSLANGSFGGFSATPLRVPGGPWTSLGVGAVTVCGLAADHTVSCWGLNFWGSAGLGRNNTVAIVTPTAVNRDAVSSLEVGYRGGCVTRENGTAWCWGYNSAGQLGDGTTDNANRPVQVGGRAPA